MHIYIILIKKTIFMRLIYQPSNNFESVNKVIGQIKVFKIIKISPFQYYLIAPHTNPKYF